MGFGESLPLVSDIFGDIKLLIMSARLLCLFISFLIYSNLCAQIQLKGRVTDMGGKALVGVTIFIASTYEGASSDSLGNFGFTTSAKTPFAVESQYLGYRTDSVLITSSMAGQMLHFRLRETAAALSEIVVTAGAFMASDTRKTAVMSSVDVATTGATADLAEALSTLPGSTPAGESGQLLVRGGSAEETQSYINGLRVPKLYSSALPDVPSRTRFSPFAFRGITFATGGFSAAYGDALSAALILQTQDLPEQNISSLNLMSLGGSVGRTQKVGDRQAFAFDVGGLHLGLYTQLNREAREKITRSPQGLNSNFAYWWTGKGGRNLKVFSQLTTQHHAGSSAQEAKFYGATDLALDNVNSYSQAAYQQPLGQQGFLQFGAAAATNLDRFTADGVATELEQTDLQLRSTYSNQLGELALWQIGAEIQGRREGVNKQIPEMTQVAQVDRLYGASFVEVDWYLSNKWVLRTGLRHDQYDFRDAILSPRLQLSHLFSANHQVALSAGQYRQRQTGAELFALDYTLSPARLDHLGLTYSLSWEGRILRAEAYAKTYHELLTSHAGSLQTRGNGYARGFDLFYRDRGTVKNADFWVSYSYNDSQREQGNLTEQRPVPFASSHNLAFVAKRFFPKPGLGLSATYRWHAGRPYDDPNREVRFDGLTRDFHDLSINVSYITNIRGHFTVIFASMTNVTGVHQVNQYRFSQQPDLVTGRYDRIDVDPLFPRFPFIGIFVSIGDKNRQATVDDI